MFIYLNNLDALDAFLDTFLDVLTKYKLIISKLQRNKLYYFKCFF